MAFENTLKAVKAEKEEAYAKGKTGNTEKKRNKC
jgi:hypothetical protein